MEKGYRDALRYGALIRNKLSENFQEMFREAGGAFSYPFLTPGSKQYSDVLWDWDSWLSNVALRQILLDLGDASLSEKAVQYERGCVQNYLNWGGMDGWIPIFVSRTTDVKKLKPSPLYSTNMHKPVLAQHAAFLVRQSGGDAEWLRPLFYPLQSFVNNYKFHHRHPCGLYFWQDDYAIGVDNDPCTYFRPKQSSASIYLNCMMEKELTAMVYLCNCLQLDEIAAEFRKDADDLKQAVQKYCWDERDGFYYSVDLNLRPNDNIEGLHSSMPRTWDCLIQRIGVWSGFLTMWAGIATPEQAKRMVEEHAKNPKSFCAPYGIRTLSKQESMYSLRASGNPSNWLGPVWGVSNYLVWRGLVLNGFEEDAKELALKTIELFGRDLERFGSLHENYQPENGEPILNPGFQNWNYLVLNMLDYMEGKPSIFEF